MTGKSFSYFLGIPNFAPAKSKYCLKKFASFTYFFLKIILRITVNFTCSHGGFILRNLESKPCHNVPVYHINKKHTQCFLHILNAFTHFPWHILQPELEPTCRQAASTASTGLAYLTAHLISSVWGCGCAWQASSRPRVSAIPASPGTTSSGWEGMAAISLRESSSSDVLLLLLSVIWRIIFVWDKENVQDKNVTCLQNNFF